MWCIWGICRVAVGGMCEVVRYICVMYVVCRGVGV